MVSPQMTVFVIATSVFYVTLWLWLLIVDKSTEAYGGGDVSWNGQSSKARS